MKDSNLLLFYEKLDPVQKLAVDVKLTDVISSLKSNGMSMHQIHMLKCTIANEMYGTQLLRG